MSNFAGRNIAVLDIETRRSAKEVEGEWTNKAGLGISIGGYYDYQSEMIWWFDERTVIDAIELLLIHRPLLVSFNGIAFDFALMRAVVRHTGEPLDDDTEKMLQAFKTWVKAESYDILAEVWRADAEGKYARGLNSLDALARANGLPPKTGNGEEAPIWWREGQHARVLNYCSHDIWLTRQLFELLAETGGVVQRSTGPLQLLRYPDSEGRIVNHEEDI